MPLAAFGKGSNQWLWPHWLEQAHQSFDEIANSVQLVQNFIAQIAEQAQQQGHAASETKHTISGVNDSAQHVGQAADNLSAGATQLVELANNLNRLVGRFDINWLGVVPILACYWLIGLDSSAYILERMADIRSNTLLYKNGLALAL